MVTDDFYRAFEDRFRGNRDLIKARQSVYLPIVDALLQRVPKKIVDIGCGRAEWLELLAGRGLSAVGLDLNDEFVARARQAGLSVIKGEATDYLGQQPDQSCALVSAFHVVEHLGFETLLTFMKQAHRVLDDGGAMLLETPNPANLVVGACNFYLDPTHERPIPSILLSFAAEFSGFERVVVVPVNRDFLQNNLELLPAELSGASVVNKVVSALDQNFMQAPDYAIIAFKKADNESIPIAESLVAASALPISQKETEDVNELFAGLLKAEREKAALQGKAELAEKLTRDAQWKLQEMQGRLELVQARLLDAKARAAAAEEAAAAANKRVVEMLNSSSWRLSSPLRFVGLAGRRIGTSPGAANRTVKLGMRHAMAYVQSRPVLKQRVANVLARFPRLRARIVRFTGLQAAQGVVSGSPLPAVETIERMTARGRAIYHDLLSARNGRTQ
ncbi:class I SAM-dependent methyltransferase [Caballeronia sp. LjRoot29]|uniref:class I SAM-dependent methyltransferase n=1 Tax=Caballeronia sp. LjRoot29 TaxID=3342315 RepID=UPI003ECDD543